MPVNPTSILSVLMNASGASDGQTLLDAMLNIQSQLSEILENQHKLMKAVHSLQREHQSRLRDLKRSTQALLEASHTEIADRLDEIQESVDEQLEVDDEVVLGDEFDLFK